MRKFFTILLIGAIFLMMGGCDGSNDDEKTEHALTASLSDGYTVTYSNAIATYAIVYCGDTYTSTMTMGGESYYNGGAYQVLDDKIALYGNAIVSAPGNMVTLNESVEVELYYEEGDEEPIDTNMKVTSIVHTPCGGGGDEHEEEHHDD